LPLALALTDEADLIALERRLGAMIRDGQLVRNRNQAFCPVNSRDLIAGRVIGHPDGFGFVRPDEAATISICIQKRCGRCFTVIGWWCASRDVTDAGGLKRQWSRF
jgi:exoribonuclease R